jgi:hypothetical protein
MIAHRSSFAAIGAGVVGALIGASIAGVFRWVALAVVVVSGTGVLIAAVIVRRID